MVSKATMSEFHMDIEREEDGRWIGEVAELPGVLAYGATREDAVSKAKALALRVLADRLVDSADL
jgi:predicted RNase H-like HicB family nuclease